MINYTLSRVRILVRYAHLLSSPPVYIFTKSGKPEPVAQHGQWAALTPQSSSPAALSFPLLPLAPLIVPSPPSSSPRPFLPSSSPSRLTSPPLPPVETPPPPLIPYPCTLRPHPDASLLYMWGACYSRCAVRPNALPPVL